MDSPFLRNLGFGVLVWCAILGMIAAEWGMAWVVWGWAANVPAAILWIGAYRAGVAAADTPIDPMVVRQEAIGTIAISLLPWLKVVFFGVLFIYGVLRWMGIARGRPPQ